MPHLSSETVDALKAIGGFLVSIGAPLWVVGKVIARKKATAFAKKWLESQGEPVSDEPVTRRVPTLPDLPPVDADINALRELVARLQQANALARDAYHEAAKLSDARERALVAAKRDLQRDLDAVRGDLVNAANELHKCRNREQVLAAEVNEKRKDEKASLSTPRSDPPGVPTQRPKPR